MSNLKFITELWVDFPEGETEALYLDVDRQYTISEFIALLEEAKKKWGDKEILIHDFNNDVIGGFSHVYLHDGFDYREEYGEEYYEDDKICIFG